MVLGISDHTDILPCLVFNIHKEFNTGIDSELTIVRKTEASLSSESGSPGVHSLGSGTVACVRSLGVGTLLKQSPGPHLCSSHSGLGQGLRLHFWKSDRQGWLSVKLNLKGFPLHTKAFLKYPGVCPLLLYAGSSDSYSGFFM